MANANDANFVNRKFDEVNRRTCPNSGEVLNTTVKKISYNYLALMALGMIIAAVSNLLPEPPRQERPRFSEGDRNNGRGK